MARVLVTGMSGAGKSTLLHEQRRRGHLTVDSVVLLSAPIETLLDRVRPRSTNPYGTTPEQQDAAPS